MIPIKEQLEAYKKSLSFYEEKLNKAKDKFFRIQAATEQQLIDSKVHYEADKHGVFVPMRKQVDDYPIDVYKVRGDRKGIKVGAQDPRLDGFNHLNEKWAALVAPVLNEIHFFRHDHASLSYMVDKLESKTVTFLGWYDNDHAAASAVLQTQLNSINMLLYHFGDGTDEREKAKLEKAQAELSYSVTFLKELKARELQADGVTEKISTPSYES